VHDTFLLAGGYSRTKTSQHSWFFPLFDFTDNGPLDSELDAGQRYANFGKDFWCLPICWYENQVSVRPRFSAFSSRTNSTEASAGSDSEISETSLTTSLEKKNMPDGTNALVRTWTRKSGAFPLWSYSVRSTPAEGKRDVHTSILALLYDYKHEIGPTFTSKGEVTKANDYTRSRLGWRLWHYEKLNGDVGVDVFPALTFDRRANGFRKTAFMWRLVRYERSPNGQKKLDVLFVPLARNEGVRASQEARSIRAAR